MACTLSLLLASLLSVSGYQLPAAAARASQRAHIGVCMAGKGFGKQPPAPPPAPKKVAATAKRSKASSDFDAMKASGAPEYMVCIRTVGAKTSEWMPVGGITVPRSNSEDMALSIAIFDNEDELLKGAFRAYPKLKTSEDKFEYGYRLKEFPDDPVKTATKEKTELTTNPIMQWFNTLDSPLNK